MIFSTPIFIVFFLPVVLAAYFLLGRKNIILLFASLLFYSWGEFHFVLLLIFSIIYNYSCGRLIYWSRKNENAIRILLLCVAGNLALLGYFKYSSFIVDIINSYITLLGFNPWSSSQIHLPLGISFFTFQAITYLVDVYKGRVNYQKNILDLALYISFFPQLIAGPIVRYHQISEALKSRIVTRKQFGEGVERFITGLAKKLIIADTLAIPADKIFSLGISELTPPLAIFGCICFSIQILFDFSGYSDMAIGLGRFFGFNFPENFNYPYFSKNIRDFWRRWHMTLSNFFRDYVYIPMGGNRCVPERTYLNLLIVFLLCGLWHGANWTFVFWGLFHGLFILLERTKFSIFFNKMPNIIQHSYVIFIVFSGWIIFRSPDIHYSISYFSSIFSKIGWNQPVTQITQIANNYEIFIAILGCLFSLPIINYTSQFTKELKYQKYTPLALQNILPKFSSYAYIMLMCILLFLSLGTMSAQTYKAFIYFRF